MAAQVDWQGEGFLRQASPGHDSPCPGLKKVPVMQRVAGFYPPGRCSGIVLIFFVKPFKLFLMKNALLFILVAIALTMVFLSFKMGILAPGLTGLGFIVIALLLTQRNSG